MSSSSTTVQSNEDVATLATANIGVQADYAFSNPYSINGPFGTLSLTLSEGATQETAVGEIVINTLFGLGTVTDLSFTGPADFTGSTGYTTINTEGHGIITVRPNLQRYINANIAISLQPGFQEGLLSVEGFFTDYPIQATAIHYISGSIT